jgi:hypothetical protein
MKKVIHRSLQLFALFSVFLTGAAFADAQKRNDREIRDAVRTLDSKLDDFESSIRYQMQSASVRNTDLSDVSGDIRVLRDNLNGFQDSYDHHRENRDDVHMIVDAARQVDKFLVANPQNRMVMDNWVAARRQIDRLSANYGVTANWSAQAEDEPLYPIDEPDDKPVVKATVSVGLSGSYALDTARSENIQDIITDSGLGPDQQEDLKDKLEAPDQISIDIRGNQVTLSTSNASPVTFIADGREKVEHPSSGKTVRIRATMSGDTLTVASRGGESDYTITFTSVSNGQGMKVSRRITTEYLNQTVIAESVYNKTNSVAQVGTSNGSGSSNNPVNNTDPDDNRGYSDNDQGGTPQYGGSPRVASTRTGDFIVPDGTTVVARLETEVNTNVSQNNDRFRMTVQSPMDFRGAVIEGYISGVGRSGRVSGQANITFNFEKITLRNGQSYDFAGMLLSVRDQSGKAVNVDNEGTVRGDSQTRETAKRGAIGGGLGAIIGAIAGGGKGAAIGAIIGAGGGAGSVAVQGRDDVRLMPNSTVTIQSTSPIQRTQQGP